jgi:hypothetical protein
VEVKIHGLEDREAPLTWGQRAQQYMLDIVLEESSRLSIGGRVMVPVDVSVDSVRSAVRGIMTRHESLRTIFPRCPGEIPTQKVLGSVDVEIATATAQTEEEGLAIVALLTDVPFDVSCELPIRFLLLSGPNYRALHFGAYHLAMDAWSVNKFKNDLSNALISTAIPVEDHQWQPCDRAAVEASAEGLRTSGRNVRLWTDPMLGNVFPQLVPRMQGASPRYRETVFDSASVSWASRLVGRRYHVPVGAVFALAIAETLSSYSGLADFGVRVQFSNRLRPADLGIDTLTQTGLLRYKSEGGSLDDRLRTIAGGLLRAYMTARYDIYQILDVRERLMSKANSDPMPQFWINLQLQEEVRSAVTPSPSLAPQGSRDLLEKTVWDVVHAGRHHRDNPGVIYLALTSTSQETQCTAVTDDWLISESGVEALMNEIAGRLFSYLQP